MESKTYEFLSKNPEVVQRLLELWAERDGAMSDSDDDDDDDIVFDCCNCEKHIIRNSREHDECFTRDGSNWYCGDCHPDDDDSDDE